MTTQPSDLPVCSRAAAGLAALLLAAGALGSPAAAQYGRPAPQGTNPTDVQLVEASLSQLQFGLRARLFTSEELVQAYLERIAAYDDGFPFLNGVLSVNPAALEIARARDDDRARGRAHGPLFGIPVLLKDNIDTHDMPTTAGSLSLAGSFPPDDAFLARRLREAGAILIGKTSLTEFANFLTTGMPSGYSSLGGFGLNPYDPRTLTDGRPVLTPGGSSSGTGISIAASLAAVGVGTETSGSILSPSSENGLVGIKPTVGLVSRDGILPITADQDTAGPMARTVTDAAILLGVLAGFDPADPATAACLPRGRCPRDYTRYLDPHALRGARIAVPHNPYWAFLAERERVRMRAAIRVLVDEGAVVLDPLEIPRQVVLSNRGIAVTYPPPAGESSVLLYGFKHDLNAYLATRGPDSPVHSLSDIIAFNRAHPIAALRYGQSIALAAERIDPSPGSADTLRYKNDRARDLQLFRGALDECFRGPDGLAGTGDEIDAMLFPSNVGADAPARAGYPSITVPGQFLNATAATRAHPFGITFTGPAFSEPRLIGLAYDFEQATHFRRPPESTPPLPRDALLTR